MSEFKPEYDGDNLNRKWVRDKLKQKAIEIPESAVHMLASLAHPVHFIAVHSHHRKETEDAG